MLDNKDHDNNINDSNENLLMKGQQRKIPKTDYPDLWSCEDYRIGSLLPLAKKKSRNEELRFLP